jgi:hypothetical protein
MLMMEQCRLLLFGNSDAEMMGLLGWQRRGGVVAPSSTRGSIATVVIDPPAAVDGVVVRRCLNMSKIKTVSAGTLAGFPLWISDPEHKDRWGGEKRCGTKPIVKCAT